MHGLGTTCTEEDRVECFQYDLLEPAKVIKFVLKKFAIQNFQDCYDFTVDAIVHNKCENVFINLTLKTLVGGATVQRF